MPTLDEVVGNLGEPLDFVEYRVHDEDEVEDGGADTNATTNAERQDGVVSDEARGREDLEAVGSSDGGGFGGHADERVMDPQFEGIHLATEC